jgi:hypothetical protein
MNLYEFTYTKTCVDITVTRKYQIPAVDELHAAVELGQMCPDSNEFPYDETIIKILSVKKVG